MPPKSKQKNKRVPNASLEGKYIRLCLILPPANTIRPLKELEEMIIADPGEIDTERLFKCVTCGWNLKCEVYAVAGEDPHGWGAGGGRGRLASTRCVTCRKAPPCESCQEILETTWDDPPPCSACRSAALTYMANASAVSPPLTCCLRS